MKKKRGGGWLKEGLLFIVLVTSKLVKAIAPEPISSTNPIVKTIKNIIAIENPKVLT